MAFNFGNTTNPGLGQPSAASKPASGFGSFSFGAPSSTPAFGATATTSTAPSFGTAPTFGTGGFGATTSTQSLGGFGGFGTTTTSAPSIFGGLGATPATTGFPAFGATATTTSAPSFGGFGAGTTAFGGFGSSFGSSFGKPATSTAPSFGGFGSGFGLQQQPQQQQLQQQLQQQQQQQQQQQLSTDDAFAQSIFNVSIFGDERDTIIAKWNYLQAMWGSGKSFYSPVAPAVDITPQNYLCRFKTMTYSQFPGKDNKAGLVALIINKPYNDVKNQQHQIIASLAQIFGSRPNIVVNVDTMKQLDEKTQVVIYVEEKSQQVPNETKRILSTEVSNFLNQPNIKPQLTNLGVEQVLALVLPDEDQLKEYLENPPKGIDPRMWRQAKIDNPDPTKFIPLPMIGFNELKWRIKCQENETETHVHYLAKVEQDLAELKQRHVAATAKIMEHRRKLAELSHRILKIVVKQECTRKLGMALSAEEEILRSKLENMQAFMSAPTQFKGRLSELLSQMRMQKNQYAMAVSNAYTLDKDSEEEMNSFLTMQLRAMEFLIDTVNKDMKALKIISEGMSQLTRM